ncbi:mucin-2-like [Morone saxatilis]|uniref:mucin-2-like n=1 Tax=Morone saxatilis TaxID=34816 RepID=UPI0015E219E3|nr:mucin-2-like [Morone saxatilis]
MKWRFLWLCFLALSVAGVINVHARQPRNHVGNVCSTWGREHFKTFDGDVYQFPGMCKYNLASDCHESYQEFSVHMKRTEDGGDPTVSYVEVTIGDFSFHLTKSLVTVNDLPVKMPYNQAGVQVERNAVYFKLQSKIGIVVIWNGDDAIMVELNRDYANRTCGLCGDFNGVSVYNEFILNGRKISPTEFGNNQKVHRPNDDCEDPNEVEDESLEAVTVPDSCKEFETTCHRMLNSESWSSCTKLINPEPYIQACAQDMCDCTNSTSDFCGCSTLSEFSRQCSHAGGQPPNWRTPEFCAKQCPFNMVYEESYSPCIDTCTLPDTSSLCEDHKMDGCFCPPGTVFDDISKRGCIAQSECQCKRNDKIYNTSEVYRQAEKNCTCFEGRWACESLQTHATCAVEEGSHVTTFDGKTYTFHGDCYYTLAKVQSKNVASPNFTIRAQLVPCKSQEFDTCLKNLKIVLNNDRNNVLMFTSEGTVKQNMQTITLPYHSGDVNIFQASSFHMLFQTSFGLQIQIQHVPIMQVYVRLEQSYRAKTRGLCGNYNMVLSDDMKTPQGIVEGTASTFTNSWKANHVCRDTEERLDDPCSLSVENENYAKHWCALLLSPNSTFAQCHSEVDPEMYYKRCIYASCNCEKSEACLCAVFSSYTHACGSKGVFLTDWRENVCDKYTRSCPASQIFSYNHQRCQLTCRSLGSKQQSCTSDFLPVDGCSCSEGQYLNENNICVPMEKCSCYHNEVYINSGKSISIKDEHCLCTNGILHCHPRSARSSICTLPKVFFNCSTAGTGEFGLQCARTCSNLDNDDCDSTECKSGCQCPSSLLDDGKGSCVKENECPCQHDGSLYPPGTQTTNQCNNCTCKGGNWKCTENKCPGTCIIYGSGHYTTFDQKTYGFQGRCDYVAVKNKCGKKTVQENFKVITENVPCGSTGTTCTKTVKVQLGRMEVKISMGKYEEEDMGKGPHIKYKIRKVGLYLVIESAIGLTVILDKKTTVRILLDPKHSGEVCGLCGNFDGNGQNDFTTNGQLTVSNQLEFANSWKVSSSCLDVDVNVDPCVERNNRHTWAKKKCSIITGDTFKDCHKKVDYHTFHDNCIKDSCACDTGGDCECFCTAVAAYAQACIEAGVCIAWRTPEICSVFCDYYNSPEECKWHYHSCHTPCYKTCLNPQGMCSNHIPNLEGCYPVCPEDEPIFDEKNNMCVETCETITNTTTPETPTTTTRSTTPPTEPTTTPETPTTTTRSTTPTEAASTTQHPTPTCPDWGKVQNETFHLYNCTMAKCIKNNDIVTFRRECPTIEKISCANGIKPVLVYDEYHCCQHYVCDCVCEGWGDPHYITFDGFYYTYQGNCTYVLMKEISPKYNLTIYIDNVYCDIDEDVSCPRSINVHYKSQAFKLKNHDVIGPPKLEVFKDGESLKLPYSQQAVKIMSTSLTMILEIPHLKVVITFGITGFSVTLPFEHFGNNTRGHCGTCNNNQTDDCMLPNGKLAQSCPVMANFWPVGDCKPPNVTVTPTCKPGPVCNLLQSSVFAECHPFVAPDKFYQACVFDSCHISNRTVECTSLQTYAAACAKAGVCVNWRNYTKECVTDCPSKKMYKPCGPAEQPTCEDNPYELTMNFTTEGCFCPEGMKLFTKESDICVKTCGCLDPDGVPREFNEKFEYNCQRCVCEESTKSVTCEPKVCPAPTVTNCFGPGFVLVNQTDPANCCCSTLVCQCDSKTCPETYMKCPTGKIPIVSTPEGKCCPEHICEPKRVCVHDDVEYQLGSSVPGNRCENCICTGNMDPKFQLFEVLCKLQQCETDCEKGYQYVKTDKDECCGKCVQTHCVLSVNGTKELLETGHTWSPPENKCEKYTCVKISGTLTVRVSNVFCPLFQESNCQPDTIQTSANGCCKICVEKEKACKLEYMKTFVTLKDCKSDQEVDMPYCEGSCNTFTKYSADMATMQHSCSCCKEMRSSNRTVNLRCMNGDLITYTYMYVEECGCGHTKCTEAAEQPARRKRGFTLV